MRKENAQEKRDPVCPPGRKRSVVIDQGYGCEQKKIAGWIIARPMRPIHRERFARWPAGNLVESPGGAGANPYVIRKLLLLGGRQFDVHFIDRFAPEMDANLWYH